MKVSTVEKSLNKEFGGTWKYNKHSSCWECDDKVRYVCEVLTGKDFEGEYTGESTKCLYYRDSSKFPEWIFGL